jgi:hypothetical protein
MTDDKKKEVKKSGKESGKSQPKTKKREELSEDDLERVAGAGSRGICRGIISCEKF